MPRLTRAQTQERNRDLLLAAARELFLRDGYGTTSLAAVAEAAGFSTGAVYSNFSGKAEIALSVLRGIQTEQVRALTRVVDGRPAAEVLEDLRQWSRDALDSGWARLELEFALDTRTEPDYVAAEAERQRTAVAAITALIDPLVPPAVSAALPTRVLAEALLNLAIGLAVRRVVDPKVTGDALIDAVRGLLVGSQRE